MTNVVPMYRKNNNNCRVATTTAYTSNSENTVACLVSGEGLLHVCISSNNMYCPSIN